MVVQQQYSITSPRAPQSPGRGLAGVLDYRALTTIIRPDRYPKAVFSKIDFSRAFHQIPVAEDDVLKIVITTPFELFEYLFMDFGLSNASQTFHRFMDRVMRGLVFV